MASRRLQVVRQDADVQPQDGARPEHVVLEAPDFRRPWFDTETAAAYLQYRGPARLRSVYRFIKTHGIAVRRRSVRSILIAKADIDRALTARKARG